MASFTNHAKVAEYFPEAYKGKVSMATGQGMTIIEAATLRELPAIFCRYGDWAVTREGVLCITQGYEGEVLVCVKPGHDAQASSL